MNIFNSAKMVVGLILIISATFIVNSCQDNQEVISAGINNNNNNGTGDDSTGTITFVSGQVISNLTGIPLDSAIVRIVGNQIDEGVFTDGQGKYSFEFDLTANSNLTIIAYKGGFLTDTTSATIEPGSINTIPLIKLEPVTSGTKPSGDPVTVYLAAQTTATIGVKESGDVETAQLVFEVQDSAGVPMDIDHSVDVFFRFGISPGGGEEISPAVVKTNDLGQATVNLTSGYKAGVVQIIAEVFLPNKTIASLPVAISIHGGLPDYDHFSIAPELLNFPGFNIFGLIDPISAYVGDKYANPVRETTSVYFTSTGGYIAGSTQTDELGVGTVELISALPHPVDPFFGEGFAKITGTTIDENSQNISRDIYVLFSGVPVVTIDPITFDIPNAGSQSFNYYVGDQNGNPLAGGTTVSVSVDGENVAALGELNFEIPDTQSQLWTQFNFLVYDVQDTVETSTPVSITVSADGPNGKANITIYGNSR